jgi:hypothetical protein
VHQEAESFHYVIPVVGGLMVRDTRLRPCGLWRAPPHQGLKDLVLEQRPLGHVASDEIPAMHQ